MAPASGWERDVREGVVVCCCPYNSTHPLDHREERRRLHAANSAPAILLVSSFVPARVHSIKLSGDDAMKEAVWALVRLKVGTLFELCGVKGVNGGGGVMSCVVCESSELASWVSVSAAL
jgi:hypothetical protein